MMELREKIARAIFFRGDAWDEKQWKHMQPRHRDLAYEQADAILAISEIAEALEDYAIKRETTFEDVLPDPPLEQHGN